MTPHPVTVLGVHLRMDSAREQAVRERETSSEGRVITRVLERSIRVSGQDTTVYVVAQER